jgi:3-deoxy-7-phosphoheptulonate synthase
MSQPLEDLRIASLRPLISPALLEDEIALTPPAIETITQARKIASEIVKHKDDRLLVIVGPCSIHDQKSALEYGTRLAELIKKYHDELCIIMRVYFEKPRTTVGWKGLINDPYLDDTFNINQGLRIARKLLRDLNTMGVPCATEFLDTIIPQYISDLISWGAIGARTTESQIHRELASGLSMPIGFKNGTDGNIQIAIDAMSSASFPHHFLGVTKAGLAAIVATKGNDVTHVILRGANTKTNYDAESVAHVVAKLHKNKLIPSVMVDCSHGNSLKDHLRQPLVVKDVANQIAEGSKNIMGVMIESHINPGRQDLKNKAELEYGQSITDACIGWHETVTLLDLLAKAVKRRRA